MFRFGKSLSVGRPAEIVGKGSPEQAQIAIQLTYRFHKTHSTPDQFVTQDFIGLDCNGCVGNYIQRAVRGLGWQQANNDADPGPTTLIGDLLEAQGKGNHITDIKNLNSGDTYILGHCAEDGAVLDPAYWAATGETAVRAMTAPMNKETLLFMEETSALGCVGSPGVSGQFSEAYLLLKTYSTVIRSRSPARRFQPRKQKRRRMCQRLNIT